MFLKKCTESKKRRKSSKIEEEAKKETEAKRLKTFHLAEKSFKLSSKSGGKLINPAQNIPPEGDLCSKWLLQTDSTILDSTSKPKGILASENLKTGTKSPPAPSPLLVSKPSLPFKRKGPGRQ